MASSYTDKSVLHIRHLLIAVGVGAICGFAVGTASFIAETYFGLGVWNFHSMPGVIFGGLVGGIAVLVSNKYRA